MSLTITCSTHTVTKLSHITFKNINIFATIIRSKNHLNVTQTTLESNTTDNDGYPSTTVSSSSGVSITMTGSPSSVAQGSTVVYTVGVTNTGPSAATSVVVTATLPSTLTLASTCAGY